MKNLTISIPDDVYRQARIKAAEQDTSVSAMVRDYLVGLSAAREHRHADAAKARRALVRSVRERHAKEGIVVKAADRLSRDEMYDTARG